MEPSSDFPFLADLLVGKTTSKPLKKGNGGLPLSLSIRYLSIKIYDESIIYIYKYNHCNHFKHYHKHSDSLLDESVVSPSKKSIK
jgi:hypothetical protein